MEVSSSTQSQAGIYPQTEQERIESQRAAQEVNQRLKADGKKLGESLGQDDFLRLLVKEMQFQDPFNPMDNKEFISQMAQISSLQQSININQSISQLLQQNSKNEMYSLLGKQITWKNEITGQESSGIAESVITAGNYTMIKVGDKMVDPRAIVKVELSSPAAVVNQDNSTSQHTNSFNNGISTQYINDSYHFHNFMNQGRAGRNINLNPMSGSEGQRSAPSQEQDLILEPVTGSNESLQDSEVNNSQGAYRIQSAD